MQVAFDDLSSTRHMSRAQRVSFWENTSRLQQGTLVLLYTEVNVPGQGSAGSGVSVKIRPCLVADRDERQLAAHNSIGLR